MAEAIRLKQTISEYLLYIPASQKERAKSIDGRRWDPERICWVYPHTERIYNALIAEFGDELKIRKGSNSFDKPPKTIPNPQSENDILKKQIIEIQETLKSLPKSDEKVLQTLQETYDHQIEAKEKELIALNFRIQEGDNQISELKKTNNSLLLSNQYLRNQQESKNPTFSLMESIKSLAIESVGENFEFKDFIGNLQFDDNRLSIELAKALEKELCLILKTSDNKLSLNDLLMQAKDANLLSPDAIDLAHIIRKQRNIIAHGDGSNQTYKSREMLSLFAAVILWQEFPE